MMAVSVETVNLDDDDDGIFILDLEGMERASATMKFQLVSDMFPDVEPVFLQAKCTDLAFDNSAFNLFIETTMLSGNYPRKAAPQPQDNQSSPVQFSSGTFSLEAYLKKYPDPETYFSSLDGARNLQFSYTYLQHRHRNHLASTIRTVLGKSKYNMCVADAKLSKMKATRKILRRPQDINHPPGVPNSDFFAEIEYIENRDTISQYLQDKAVARQNAVEEARKALALLTCGCCFSDDLLAEEVSSCSEGHIFCKSCILRSSEVQMGDNKIDFPCLQECSGIFSLQTLKEILPPNAFEKLEKKLQEREIASANISGLETCAFCEYSAIPPEEDRIFNCDNCKKKMCRLCRRESHIPFSCEEKTERDEKENDRLTVEEKMTDALLRTCWKCKTKFIREDGCNKMTCVCGAKMCYVCRKPVKDYSHFVDNSLARPRDPSNGSSGCPLWTSNKLLHQDDVLREGRKAIDDLKRKNPELEQLLNKKRK